jgi:hypothetical protein
MGSKREDRPTSKATRSALSKHEMEELDAYWRAANYLSVGQFYLYDNPLLRVCPVDDSGSRAMAMMNWSTSTATSPTLWRQLMEYPQWSETWNFHLRTLQVIEWCMADRTTRRLSAWMRIYLQNCEA